MTRDDLVTPDLRAVEREVDREHLSNFLVSFPFASAVWHFLAACEEWFVRHIIREWKSPEQFLDDHSRHALADQIVNMAKWPMRWLSESCPPGGKAQPIYGPEPYEAAWELSQLALDYMSFESVFTYASWGFLNLDLQGDRIVPSGALRTDTRYQAYDRLLDAKAKEPRALSTLGLIERLGPSVRVDGRRFTYTLNPRLMKDAADWAAPNLLSRFTLPPEWRLTRYSLDEYASVMQNLWLLSSIHFTARMVAVAQQCKGLGYDQALLTMSRQELVNRLKRYSGLPRDTVSEVLEDLTYGARGIRYPDVALQPLVAVGSDSLCWAPNIIASSNLERNLVVLLNRLPESREAYSKLSQLKEDRLRSAITDDLGHCDYRFWWGAVQGWSPPLDIDLAIVSDREKTCLLLELKSFVAPADLREIREKGEEIARGIDQVGARRDAARSLPEPLLSALGVDPSYRICWSVVSENSIGPVWVQDERTPVIRASHLTNRFDGHAMPGVCDWLEARAYLPIDGEHYETVPLQVTIGEWTLEWYGIRGLSTEWI